MHEIYGSWAFHLAHVPAVAAIRPARQAESRRRKYLNLLPIGQQHVAISGDLLAERMTGYGQGANEETLPFTTEARQKHHPQFHTVLCCVQRTHLYSEVPPESSLLL